MPKPLPPRPLRILYVASGLWSYRPMDDGIIDALREAVTETRWVVPTDDVVGIAREWCPDLVLALNSVECLKADQVRAMKEMSIRTAVWFTDDPYYSDVTGDLAVHYEYVFTLDVGSVEFYRDKGCSRVYHLPFAANTQLYYPKRIQAAFSTDICFIGSAFRNRLAFFDQLAPYLSRHRVMIAGYWWDRLEKYSLLQNQIRLGYWLSPEDAASWYSGSRIVINLHRAVDDDTNRNSLLLPAKSLNPRSYEIGACGTLQLTDIREDLGMAYQPGGELATFVTPEEAMERIDYYLQHEEERREMAWRGLARTMKDHTYRNRIHQLLEYVF